MEQFEAKLLEGIKVLDVGGETYHLKDLLHITKMNSEVGFVDVEMNQTLVGAGSECANSMDMVSAMYNKFGDNVNDFVTESRNNVCYGQLLSFKLQCTGDMAEFVINLFDAEVALMSGSVQSVVEGVYGDTLVASLRFEVPCSVSCDLSAAPSGSPSAPPSESQSPSSSPTVTTTMGCDVIKIDFETYVVEKSLNDSFLLPDAFSIYGMTINANSSGGFTPSNKARLMDTNPSDSSLLFDKSFGSPNELCANIAEAGPGLGNGGVVSNCDGLGHVIIIQDSDEPIAKSSEFGGDITFTFVSDVEIMELTLFNVRSGGMITLETMDGSLQNTLVDAMEPNSVVTFELNVANVVKVEVTFDGVGAIADVGICTRIEILNNPVPSVIPSPQPSEGPTLLPSPTEGCPEDVELLASVGQSVYPNLPIVILEQNRESVRFMIKNTWSEIVTIFTQYHESPTGQTECFEDENLESGDSNEFFAFCMRSVPITIVDIWVVSDTFFTGNDTAGIPECCHPSKDFHTPTVQYTFKLYCVSECVPTSAPLSSRRLESEDFADGIDSFHDNSFKERGSGWFAREPSDDGSGHFCVSEDFPCGEKGDMVYVCHYSAKYGYQTYCVPEPDSDILGFYPKDYCGRCVGGYKDYSLD
jgi:hypothetical protein